MISLGQHENRPVKTGRVGEKADSIAQGVALTLSGKCESLCSASGSGKVLATPLRSVDAIKTPFDSDPQSGLAIG
jgi:hypothetical protein